MRLYYFLLCTLVCYTSARAMHQFAENSAGIGDARINQMINYYKKSNNIINAKIVSHFEKLYHECIMSGTPASIESKYNSLLNELKQCSTPSQFAYYVHAPDQYGWTPLMTAAAFGYASAACFLVQQGANIYATTNSGLTVEKCCNSKLSDFEHLTLINHPFFGQENARSQLYPRILRAMHEQYRRPSCSRIAQPDTPRTWAQVVANGLPKS